MSASPVHQSAATGLRIGLPIWGFRPWLGSVYRRDAKNAEFLRQYASAFTCVEGNTTFYNVPSPDTVVRWRDETPASFRFCFKFPRHITHDAELIGVGRETRDFLSRMAPLGERLGPFMLQLPARFGPSQLGALDKFLGELPGEFSYGVELRHIAFFSAALPRERARDLLTQHACNWIHLDTASLRSGPQNHPAIVHARHPKPDLPIHPTRTADQPIVRFIGHPELEYDEAGLASWAKVLAGWMQAGAQPYLFVHCPDDSHAPAIARRAHQACAREHPIEPAAPWPGECEPKQLTLW